MKVLITAPFSTYSGYGNDGIGMARAFIRMGADVYLQPTSVTAPLPMDVAALLTKEVQAPFDLNIIHVDPGAMKLKPEMARVADLTIGWTMWEYDNFGNLKGRSKLKKNLQHFDALIGYDEVSSNCLKSVFDGPVITQQGGFWPEDWKPIQRNFHDEDFYFCMIGVLSERKDPWVAIQAFSDAREQDPEFAKHGRLALKTSLPGLHSKMEDVFPGLRIFYDVWPTEVVKQFYAANHVLLAPSRGEGKNMPALEFQSTGGVVIATNWGGHREWLDPAYSYPLDYELAPVNSDFPNTHNARASVEHLTELMLHTFHNRDEVRRKGELAAQIIPQLASWDNAVERLFMKLKDVPGGDLLWTKKHLLRKAETRGDR